jgi:branched-chain amino acid transport system ATP-binding protein
VFDNVRIGGHARCRRDFVSDTLHLPWVRRQEKVLEETVWGFLDLLELREVAHLTPDGLPFGTRKRVELARALAARPKLLLLDEPAGGLNLTRSPNSARSSGAFATTGGSPSF